ncbi:MAG TPA: Pr6Pr family membrane protein [Steroidobacteraceae bacterium]|nr:Pr6Pr family membrane protein [Steroidobacteraceae bacterium]
MHTLKLILRPLLGLLTLAAIGSQLLIHVRLGANVVNFFSYFTNLSNLIAAAVLLLTTKRQQKAGRFDRLRAFSTVNMVVVGIVFSLLLRNVELGALQPWVNFVLHYLMPCAVLLDWLLDPPSTRLGTRDLILFLIFPAAYLAYSLLRGAQMDWYPYPFLNPDHIGGYGGVVGYSVGITVSFLLVGWAVLAVGNRRQRN